MDEEISFDFSKISGLFKGKRDKRKKRQESSKKQDSEEPTINLENIKSFFEKYSTVLLITLIVLFTIYIRIQPLNLPIADDWARNNVYSYIKNNIRQQINKQFPNLPDFQKNKYVDENFKAVLESNKDEIEDQIKKTADYLRSEFQYKSGNKTYTFLGDLDSYHWLRYTRNLVEKGMYGDEVRNGRYYDTYMIAPIGTYTSVTLHPYVIYYLYLVMRFFDKSTTLMQASFYVPTLLSIIAAIAAFLIGRLIAGNIGGFFSALMLTVNPFFIRRTIGSDNDIYNVLFPLLIVWAFLEAFEAKDSKRRFFYATLSGLFLGIFSFSWMGWWYIFDIIIAGLLIYLAYLLIPKVSKHGFKEVRSFINSSKVFKSTITVMLVFIISSGFFVSIFKGPSVFLKAPFYALQSTKLKVAVKTSLWPNIYTTVAELNPGSWNEIFNSLAGKLFFYIALLGIILSIFKRDEDGNLDVKLPIVLSVWFFVSIYASLTGVRFIILFIPAFVIAFGVAFGLIAEMLPRFFSKLLDINSNLMKTIIVVLLLVLVITPVKAGISTSRSYIPSINKTWYTALKTIDEKASKDAIINSWWDFGHWFKYFADRRVTLDGASQNSPQAYWLGRMLVSDNEEETIAVLRMLDCGSNKAFEEVDKVLNDTETSVSVVRKIIMMPKQEVPSYLKKLGFNDSSINKILNYTHCNPPEDYLITSDDMIGKAGVWAHFGLWNFRRAKLINIVKEKGIKSIDYLVNKLNYSEEEARRLYNEIITLHGRSEEDWVAPWPGFISMPSNCEIVNETKLKCYNNIQGQNLLSIVDLKTMDVQIPSSNGVIKPLSAVFSTPSGIKERVFDDWPDDKKFKATIVIVLGDTPKSFWCSRELAKSTFTRLYFMNANGMRHFRLLTHNSGPFGTNVYVWNVTWNPKDVVENNTEVTVDYTGYFANGTVFDSSIINWEELNITKESNFDDYLLRKPLRFTVGKSQVIRGFERGVLGMKVGEEKTIIVSPDEGYKQGELANKTLYFKVRVLNIV